MKGKKIDVVMTYYQKYRDSLLIIALSYTHNRMDAEDLVQSAFVKALLSYKEEGSFLYWANRVMRNEWYSMVKKRNKEHSLEELPDVFSDERDPLEAFIKDDRRRWLAKTIAQLPEKYRDIMIEHVYLRCNDEQIAADHGTNPTNIRKIRSRAKKILEIEKEKYDGKRK